MILSIIILNLKIFNFQSTCEKTAFRCPVATFCLVYDNTFDNLCLAFTDNQICFFGCNRFVATNPIKKASTSRNCKI